MTHFLVLCFNLYTIIELIQKFSFPWYGFFSVIWFRGPHVLGTEKTSEDTLVLDCITNRALSVCYL